MKRAAGKATICVRRTRALVAARLPRSAVGSQVQGAGTASHRISVPRKDLVDAADSCVVGRVEDDCIADRHLARQRVACLASVGFRASPDDRPRKAKYKAHDDSLAEAEDGIAQPLPAEGVLRRRDDAEGEQEVGAMGRRRRHNTHHNTG